MISSSLKDFMDISIDKVDSLKEELELGGNITQATPVLPTI